MNTTLPGKGSREGSVLARAGLGWGILSTTLGGRAGTVQGARVLLPVSAGPSHQLPSPPQACPAHSPPPTRPPSPMPPLTVGLTPLPPSDLYSNTPFLVRPSLTSPSLTAPSPLPSHCWVSLQGTSHHWAHSCTQVPLSLPLTYDTNTRTGTVGCLVHCCIPSA